MKNVIIIFFLFLSANALHAQEYIYAELDQELISLWLAANEEDEKSYAKHFRAVSTQFKKVYGSLNKKATPHFNKVQFQKYCNTVLQVLKRYIQKPNAEKIKFFTMELLFENASLRGCLSEYPYPLDDFLILFESYESVQSIVKDPMMDLLEWFEFMKLVTLMVENWEIYDCKSFEEIQKYFPNISEAEHQLQKNKANDCLNTFTESLNTADRIEFELPCDDLGIALSHILNLYGHD